MGGSWNNLSRTSAWSSEPSSEQSSRSSLVPGGCKARPSALDFIISLRWRRSFANSSQLLVRHEDAKANVANNDVTPCFRVCTDCSDGVGAGGLARVSPHAWSPATDSIQLCKLRISLLLCSTLRQAERSEAQGALSNLTKPNVTKRSLI